MTHSFRNILVTGGGGCIGLQVCRELSLRGLSVQLFDLPEQIARVQKHILPNTKIHYGSILDCSSLRDAMAQCDAVIHLAAYLGVRRSETNRLRCIEININGTKNVLDAAIQHRIKKIVFASSSEVYGEPKENPVHEHTQTQGKSVYAITKLAGEELCKAYVQRYPELSYTILRYFNTFGPYQIAQFVIPKFIRNVMEGRPMIIYGDGAQKRAYCYASDTAWATVEALFHPKTNGEILNIGNSKEPLSLVELAELIIHVSGNTGRIIPKFQEEFQHTDRSKDREIFERFCDTQKALEMLQFVPKVSTEEGIRRVIEHGMISPKWESTDLEYTIDESVER